MGAMASGIVEVELPAEYKLKNIEETEKVKYHLCVQYCFAMLNHWYDNNCQYVQAKQELKRKKQEEAEIRKAKPAFHRFRPQYQIGQCECFGVVIDCAA